MHNIKVSKILEALNRDGWELVAQNGSHWKIQSELTPRANVSLTPENFLILTP